MNKACPFCLANAKESEKRTFNLLHLAKPMKTKKAQLEMRWQTPLRRPVRTRPRVFVGRYTLTDKTRQCWDGLGYHKGVFAR